MSYSQSEDDENGDAFANTNNAKLQKQLWIRKLTQTEGCFESPVDMSISKSKEITLPPLMWHNFEIPPKKAKLTNTGQTINFSAKWGQERPYLSDGPFLSNYVFSNWHLHWGANAMEGSEHTIDGIQYPAEMHVVFFKSCYLTQEAALKEQDGCATLCYIFKLQEEPNLAFQEILNALPDIQKPGMSKKLQPFVIANLVRQFTMDYLMYWGSVCTSMCEHYILWLINRVPMGVSNDQLNELRFLCGANGEPLVRNFRKVQDLNNRSVFHVNPSTSKYATLLSVPDKINLLYRCEIVDSFNLPTTDELVVLNYHQ